MTPTSTRTHLPDTHPPYMNEKIIFENNRFLGMSNLPPERALVIPLPPRAPRHWVYPAPRGLGELPRGVTSKVGGIPWREHSPTQIKGPTERSVVAGSLFWQQLLGEHW